MLIVVMPCVGMVTLVMLTVGKLTVITLSVYMLTIVMLIVVMLTVVMLAVVMLNVKAPLTDPNKDVRSGVFLSWEKTALSVHLESVANFINFLQL
jgi:hypothetical protein